MAEFANLEQRQRIQEALERLAGRDVAPLLDRAFDASPNPDLALLNLERWVQASSNPSMQVENLLLYPSAARLLATLMGASQPIADSLVQNPELAGLLFEPEALDSKPTVESVLAEGRALLRSAGSFSHRLDRLRFLRQRWTLVTVVNDLYRRWDEESVWRSLSDLADALIALALEVAREEYLARKGLDGLPEMMVVGFGKLGGRELNYSSDVDLVYVCPDGLDERQEAHLGRLAELLNRVLSDRMGRGALYRVDLRLRPYGGAGGLVRSMRAHEAYYRSYAEGWERLALVRSRPLVGPEDLRQRWEAMRREHCFRRKVGDIAVEEAWQLRARIEEIAKGDDLKRGSGGIRDVEFFTQILQTIHGADHPEVQAHATCDALRALARAAELPEEDALALIAAYRFLRQLEHRCQLVGDVQTHSLPTDPAQRRYLAKSMGLRSWDGLSRQLESHRAIIRAICGRMDRLKADSPRDRALARLGPFAPAASQWLDGLPEPEPFYRALHENQGSLDRVGRLLAQAPVLCSLIGSNLSLVEQVFSGEIEEEADPAARLDRLSGAEGAEAAAAALRESWLRLAGRWVLEPSFDLCDRLTRWADAALRAVARRVGARFGALALGSFAVDEQTLVSDADLLLLIEDGEDHRAAEESAQAFLAELGRLKTLGSPLTVDLRLRPEGRQGLLVRSLDGFRAYESTAMEMWERFALGQCRLLWGPPSLLEAALEAAYNLPLTPERLEELLAMKRRIETERVTTIQAARHVKLGPGGLSDIDWLVHLHEMRYPTATNAGRNRRMEDRIHALAAARLINVAEEHE
ncbi:MAG: DUF294 nucleotidyltransferase-like domain-containing protein, partial [Fimbriimonadales bacterium]|nr:DUF294 nucleotidyltransferase-like domain-containing protein [Fimbriimonadales bacterium]